jgi:hypothetical protein
MIRVEAGLDVEPGPTHTSNEVREIDTPDRSFFERSQVLEMPGFRPIETLRGNRREA